MLFFLGALRVKINCSHTGYFYVLIFSGYLFLSKLILSEFISGKP